MYPPIFSVCAANAAVLALLGSNPVRLYEFGKAPQNVVRPYAVWQRIGGSPENYLGGRPDIDLFSLQIDAYGTDSESARGVARAIEIAIELNAHVTSYNGELRDPDTNLYRYIFTIDWWVKREASST